MMITATRGIRGKAILVSGVYVLERVLRLPT